MPNRWWRLTRKPLLGGLRALRPPDWSAAVAASEGRGPTVIALVDLCRGLRRPVFGVMSKISISSQDDLGQGPACSALAKDQGAGPLTSICLGSLEAATEVKLKLVFSLSLETATST